MLGGTVCALAAYALRKTLIARLFDLPPARYGIRVRRNLRVPAHDGVSLATDHYAPAGAGEGDDSFPTILIRTPYGKALAPAFHARRFAERGYHVVVQDVRGRFASDGNFEPFIHEKEDGVATVAWLQEQPWFNSVLGTWGQSYLAYTQWALSVNRPQALTAMFPSLPSSRGPFSGQVDDAQLLELPLRWMVILEALRHLPGGRGSLAPWIALWRLSAQGQNRTLADVFGYVPLEECDKRAIGQQVPYFRQVMGDVTPSHWPDSDFAPHLSRVRAPVHLLGGWYDFMLGDMLRDYATLRAAGNEPYLTIGSWHHVHPEISRVTLREGLVWFDAHLKGRRERLRRKPVCVYLMGAGQWRQYDDWPPASQPATFFLHAGKTLSSERAPADTAADEYVYDPNDPTPAVGGPLFFSGAGSRDNRALETRQDVLTFTTSALAHDLDVVGPVKSILYVSSNREYTDVFARLCDVHPDGRSMNICDGIVRLYPGKGVRTTSGATRIKVDMWATAHRFRRGHAIRLQISSGAHPRFAPNPGIGEPPRSPDEMRVAHQTVYHDAAHPSTLILPVV